MKNRPAFRSNDLPETGRTSGLSAPIAFAVLTMGAIAMGMSPMFVRFSETGPFASAFWRVFLALPVLLLWALWELRSKSARLKLYFPPIILWAAFFFSADLVFWHLCIVNTTMANATLIICLVSVWTALFSGIYIGEPVSRNSRYGIALCLLGTGMLVGSSYSVDPSRITGDLFGVITSIFFALYVLTVRAARRSKGGGELILFSTIISCFWLFFAAVAASVFAGHSFFPSSATGVASLIMLGVVSHAGGQGLLAIALGSLSAVFSSLSIFIEAVAGAFFGWLAFGENFHPAQIAGAMVILSGLWIARPQQE